MSEVPVRRMVWGAAVLVLAAGLLSFGRAARVVRETRERAWRKQADIAALAVMEAELAPCLAAFDRFQEPDALRNAASGFDRLVEAALPGVVPADSRSSVQALVPGWELQRRELTFQVVPFERILTLATTAEQQRPPWRLVDCSLRSGPGSPGLGQATVTFERCAPVAP